MTRPAATTATPRARPRRRFELLALCLVLAGCADACKSSRITEVEGALLADAMGHIDAPEGGAIVALLPDQGEVVIPDADAIVLAIDRRVPWGRVKRVLDQVDSSGAGRSILVSRRGLVRGFVLEDEHRGRPGVELLGFPSSEGWKSCVRPRGGDEAKCAHQHGGRHIDAAFTRELVREAVRAYRSRDVVVGIPVSLPWGDAVRLIDAARTCCFEEEIRVEIISLDARGAPISDD